MSMEFDGSATVYKCSKCGDLQIVMEGEQPPDECNLCDASRPMEAQAEAGEGVDWI